MNTILQIKESVIKDFNNITLMLMALLFFSMGFNLSAQSVTPGGTSYNVEFWLKADQLVTNQSVQNRVQVTRWEDANGKVFVGNAGTAAGAAPAMKYDGMNFHPSVDFEAPAKRLVSENNFQTEASTSRMYRSFYITSARLTGTNYGTVFAYRDNQDEGWRGATNADYLYYNNGSLGNFSPGVGKRYGITSMDRAGIVWHNAKPITGTARAVAAGNGRAIIGTRTATGTVAPFYGDIQEIIVLSTPVGTPFDPLDIQKVTSYLAIKYGQTLESDQPNLYASNGTMVWDASVNGDYTNNVFGIGRDDATGLYQRQSVNYEDQTLTAFLGNALANLNSDNSGILTDMTYLVLGSNGQNGTTPYVQPDGTEFFNRTLTDVSFSMRQNRLYKAQLTGAMSLFTNLQLKNFKARYIMVSNSTDFLPENTRLYSINANGIANNVEIYDGDFIGFVLLERTPGGITGYSVELWLKADEIQSGTHLSNNANVTRWENQSGAMMHFVQDGITAVPIYKQGGMNYNPAVHFVAPAKKLVSDIDFQTEAGRNYRTFYVSSATLTGTAYGTVFGYRNTLEEGWRGATNADYLYRITGTTNTPFSPGIGKRYGIVSMDRSDAVYHNAKQVAGTPQAMVTGSGKAVIGTRGPALATNPFYGDIQEIIVLSTPVGTPFSLLDIQKINSYLAIKYGQTLESDQPDLYASDGEMVWQASKNSGYTNHVFGIARDDGSGLYQKQSTNVDDVSLTAFLGTTLYNLSSSNAGTLNNMTYLILGSNGLTGTSPYSQADSTEFVNHTIIDEFFSKRQDRMYKAQLTGADSITISLQTKNLKAKYIMVSNAIDFLPENTRLYPLTPVGVAENVKMFDGDYIGFVLSEKAPGGVTNYRLELWLKADEVQQGSILPNNAPVTRWENQSERVMNFVSSGTTIPVYTHNGMNFNPAVNFSTSARRLVSDVPFPVEAPANRIYRSFYVTKSILMTSYGAVFSYNTNYDEGWYSAANYLYAAGTAVTTYNPGLPQRYGITSVDRSSNTVWHNATPASGGTARPLVASATSFATIGTRGAAATTYPFYGDIQEVIILSTTPGTPFNQADIRKINSYLAIKYGQTLDTIQQPNLYSSSGSVVWDAVANRGYNNNMFGIARDEATGLYQKQSTNVNNNTLTLFLGSTLYALSEQNRQTLPNNAYLIIGSNGKSINANATAAYNYLEEEQFANLVTDFKLNYRTALTYRAQITTAGAQGGEHTVSMQITSLRPRYVLVSGNPAFPALETYIYPIVDRKAMDVVINDGDYITFGGFEPTPGGLGIGTPYILDLWVDGNHSTNTSWENIASSNYELEKFSTHAPIVRNSGFNFHKEIFFGNATSSKLRTSTPYNLVRGESYYVFVVSESPNLTGTLLTFNNSATTTSMRWITGTGNILSANWNTTERPSGISGQPRFGIATLNIVNSNSSIGNEIYLNGSKNTFNLGTTTAAGSAASNVPLLIGNANNGVTTGSTVPFNGAIQEIIVMRRPANVLMPANDIARIHSYLAIKYGITLNEGSDLIEDNYIASDGTTVVWDRADNAGYNHHIFGIGRDDFSGIYQKQARSASFKHFTVYVGDALANLNNQNMEMFNDMQYLMIGSNGTRAVHPLPNHINDGDRYQNDTIATSEPFNIQSPIFKTQMTGMDSIRIKVMGPNDFLYAMVSIDTNFHPANTRIYPVVEKIAEIDLTEEYKYFKLVAFAPGPGGITSGLVMWLRADNDVDIDIRNFVSSNLTSTTYNSLDLLSGYSAATGEYFSDDAEIPVVLSWRDLARGHTYSNAGADNRQRVPVYVPNNPEMNFHPAVRFWGNANNYSSYLANNTTFPMGAQIPENGQHTVYFMVNNDFSTNPWIYMLGFGNITGGGASFQAIPQIAHGVERLTRAGYVGNLTGRFRTRDSDVSGSLNLFNLGATSMLGYETRTNNSGSNNNGFFRFNGREDNSSTSPAAADRTFAWTTPGFQSPSVIGSGYAHNRTIQGFMSEVVLYNRMLTIDEQIRLESYMAFKYGITLRPSNTSTQRLNYTLSNGEILWKGDAPSGKFVDFYSNIAAVLRDDIARIENRHSHSTDVGSIMYMGVAGTKLCNCGNFTGRFENDLEAVIWGSQVIPGTSTPVSGITKMEEEDCGAFTDRFNRIWLVHKYTQNNRPVDMIVAARNNLSLTFGAASDQGTKNYYDVMNEGYDFYLIVADSPEDIESNNFKMVVPMNWIEGKHQVVYTFTEDDTYITFGYRQNGRGCLGNPEAEFTGTRKFDWAQWTANTNLRPASATDVDFTTPALDLTNAIQVNSRVRYQGGTYSASGTGVRTPRRYPRSVNTPERGSIEIRRRGGQPNNSLSNVIATVTFTNPVIPEFYISGIDGNSRSWENIEIIGQCNGTNFHPRLYYGTNENTSRYVIRGNKATAKRRGGTMAAANRRGMVNVSFEGGITNLIINYGTTNRRSTGTQRLFISPITILPVLPPPPVNEDGLAFWMNASPRETLLCREVSYIFNIQNANCERKPANFSFTLPDGMAWDCRTLSINEEHIEEATVACNGATLTIDNLMLSGADITSFRAVAYFEYDAEPGTYSTRARIDYDIMINDILETSFIKSWDYLYGNVPTEVTALPVEMRSRPIEVDFMLDRPCYGPNDIVQATITINNPNAHTLYQAGLDVAYNEEFIYSFGSLNSETLNLREPEFDDEDEDPDFSLWGTEFDIPPGTHTITFKVIAPATLMPDYDENNEEMMDENGNPVYAPFSIAFDFSSLSEYDECGNEAFRNAYGEIEIVALPDVYIMGETTICIGETTQLSRWLGGTWESSHPEIAIVEQTDTEATVITLAGGTVTFLFTVNGSDCVAETEELIVNDPAILGDNSVCVGNPIVLSSLTNGEWESSNTSIATISPNGQVTGIAAGTVTITFTTEGNCIDTKEITVYFTPVPTVLNNDIDYKQHSIAPNLITATGASAHSGHTLKWYSEDGVTEFTPSNDPINTYEEALYQYYVSQINDETGCESEKIPVTIEITSACLGLAAIADPSNKCVLLSWDWLPPIPTGNYSFTIYQWDDILDDWKVESSNLSVKSANVCNVPDTTAPETPEVNRANICNNEISILSFDKGSIYKFHIMAIKDDETDYCHSNNLDIEIKIGLWGYFISEDNDPNGVPPVDRDGLGNIITPLTILATDGQEVIYIPSNPENYIHVQAVDSAGNLSEVATIKLDIYKIPDTPELKPGANTIVCEGEIIDIDFLKTLVNTNMGDTLEFYKDVACTEPFTIVIATPPSETIYVIERNVTTDCATDASNALELKITVNAHPEPPVVASGANTIICEGEIITIDFLKTLIYINTGDTLEFYSDVDCTEPFIPVVATTPSEIIYVIARTISTGCANAVTNALRLTIRVGARPATPVVEYGTNTGICMGETIDVDFLKTLVTVNMGDTLEFYKDADCTEPFTPMVATTSLTKIYVIAKTISTGCATEAIDALELEITVNDRPLTPIIASDADPNICEDKIIDIGFLTDLVEVSAGDTLEFYKDADCTERFISAVATIPSVTVYVIARNIATGCATAATNALELEITVKACHIKLNLTLFLQGVLTSGTPPFMTNHIQVPLYPAEMPNLQLPVTNPYGIQGNYFQINDVSGPAGAIVDWILVEIWGDFTVNGMFTNYTLLEQRALLLKPNGLVVDTTGKKPQFVPFEGDVRIVVKHRNHLSVASSELLAFSDKDTVTWDFSTGVDKALKPPLAIYDPMILQYGVACLWAGDLNMNGFKDHVDMSIFNIIWKSNIFGQYMVVDVNMDGTINNLDNSFVTRNIKLGLYSPVYFFIKR